MQVKPLPEHLYTIAEWEKLPDSPRTELIDGHVYLMAPPVWDHQRISGDLFFQLKNYLLGKRCVVAQDVGVQLLLNTRRPSVFIPDLIVVCDKSKVKPQGVVGAPDLVIEILSPSTAGLDKVVKLNRYQQASVREYWVVDPVHQLVDVFLWEKSPAPQTYTRKDKLHVGVLDDCDIDLSLVFPEREEEPVIFETYDEDINE